MDHDEEDPIFARLEAMQRGSRDFESPRVSHHYRADAAHSAHDRVFDRDLRDARVAYDDGYGLPEEGYVEDLPHALDSFDERVLRQPDYDTRQGQAALGQARLSLRPTRNHREPPAPRSQWQPTFAQPRQDLSRFTFGSESSNLSSPSYNASQRHPQTASGEALRQSVSQALTPTINSHPSKWDLQTSEDDIDNGVHDSSSERLAPAFEQKPASAAQSTKATSKTPVVQGINLISTRDLPDRFRPLFPFPLFNAVQSKCFDVVYGTNDNFVVSAPTGSGKTAVLELAMCRLINGWSNGSYKVVYMAPTKSLCSERQRDWQKKFGPLDLHCAELTGDTEAFHLKAVQSASVIITTPEKWDSMTRKWKDHQKLMQMVKLLLIDEVHILNEDRGATLEALVSRMKSVCADIRFVALSATVPNSQDIATWLGKNLMNADVPAPRERFGEEFRPVRLQKHVCGYHNSGNDFAFEKTLTSKITDVIAKWSQRKPIMVFCFTRAACAETAKALANWWSSSGPKDRYWTSPRQRIALMDKQLNEVASAGVAFHHAGISIQDRNAIEKAYLEGNVNVICCTSTLAVGVNLPCHMVIIKNTITWTNNGVKEYSDLDVMQMLGRAGRPQFDDSAVAVIMTALHKKDVYEKMMAGQEVLESRLHLNLIDHLNAEIGLGTVTSVSSAKKWLTGTFLYVRLKDNPEHYKIADDAPGRNLDERLENICKKGIKLLIENDLVRGAAQFQTTSFGEAMARYYVQFETMTKFMALGPGAKISEILSAIAQAAEFKEIRFRAGEKSTYKELNKNASIKFPIPVNIDLPVHKISLIIQSVLGALDLPTEDFKQQQEYSTCKNLIFQHIHRLIRCIIDCQLFLEDSLAARSALMLARSFGAQVWDDSPLHMMQLGDIGIVRARKLVGADIRSIEDIANAEPALLEKTVSRYPPYGSELRQRARAFPHLRVSIKTVGDPIIKKGEHVTIRIKAEIGFMNEKVPEAFNSHLVYVCLLAETSDGKVLHFARTSARQLNKGKDVLFSANLTSATQAVRASLMCDDIAGTQRTVTMKPEIPAFMFPAPAPKAVEANPKQENLRDQAPKTIARKTATTNIAPPTEKEDEFGDDAVNDDDLVAAEAGGYADIDDFDDDGNEKTTQATKFASTQARPEKGKESSTSRAVQDSGNWEPRRLENGKWACNHKCQEKTKCKHLCCKEGTDNKPKPPKPKEPKKNEQPSDPKQTQLSLSSSKLTSTSKQSTKPASSDNPPKAANSKEARDLNRLHNSVKSATPNVPLLQDRARTQATASSPESRLRDFAFANSIRHPDDDTKSSDYGLDSLDTFDVDEDLGIPSNQRSVNLGGIADPKESDDEMLDDPEPRGVRNTIEDISNDDEDFGRFSDNFDPDFDTDAGLAKTQGPDYGSKGTSGNTKGLFITGDSSSGDSATAERQDSQVKRPLNDANTSNYFAASKRQKVSRKATSLTDHDSENIVQTSDAPELSLGDATTQKTTDQEQANEESEMSAREWFEKEFGTELFNVI